MPQQTCCGQEWSQVSRLAAEIIFDLGRGDAFVVRTAGHVLDDAVLGSLEYAVSVLGVPLIVRPGPRQLRGSHRHEGRCENRDMPPRFIRDPVERITPSVLASLRDDKTEVNDMVIEHARQTVDRLLESS